MRLAEIPGDAEVVRIRVRTPIDVPPGHAMLRVGPWPMPMTDQQLQMMDRMIARARSRALPFLSVVDDGAQLCVAFVVEPLPNVSIVAVPATEGVVR